MVRKHSHAPSRTGDLDGGIDGGGKNGQFVVDLNTNGLKGALGGVSATTAGGSRNGVTHDRGKLHRAFDRAIGHDRPSDSARKPLVAVHSKDFSQFIFAVAIDHVGRTPRTGWIHPHIDRAVVAIGEAALGDIKLRGRNPQVEEDGRNVGNLKVGHEGSEGIEPPVHSVESIAVANESS